MHAVYLLATGAATVVFKPIGSVAAALRMLGVCR